MNDRPMNRRRFFREGIFELLRPLADVVKPLADAAKQLSDLENLGTPAPSYTPTPATPSYSSEPVVRPPGAMSEDAFGSVCSRCSDCIRACPAQCIVMDETAYKGGGAPYIDTETRACTVCETVPCSSACPMGALVPTHVDDIKMGLAVWHEDTCIRSTGGECTACIDKCPLGAKAIRLSEGRIEVLDPGCIGCGMCQQECPSYPKSITVTPTSARQTAYPYPD